MNNSSECGFIRPDWPAPENIRAFCTTRNGGYSKTPWDSFNLADHVGDAPQDVKRNRDLLKHCLSLPAEPFWLRQVHGCEVISPDQMGVNVEAECDASVSFQPGRVCAVLTADCLPVLLCNLNGDKVAAVHAGWRGLASGVIEQAVQRMACPGEDLLAWLGPAIGPEAFEVGDEVRRIFTAKHQNAHEAFIRNRNNRWLCDLYQLARQRLETMNVEAIYGGDFCTYTDADMFFSYRRDGQTGRMACLIWIDG